MPAEREISYAESAAKGEVGIPTKIKPVDVFIKPRQKLVWADEIRRPKIDARVESTIFSPSVEAAWFLGTLFGNQGTLRSRSKLQLIGTSEVDPVLVTYLDIGSTLLSKNQPKKVQGHLSHRSSGSYEAYFHSSVATAELNGFTRQTQAAILSEPRFSWLLKKPYIGNFASGIFDSSAVIEKGVRNSITFSCTHEESADFLVRLMTRLGAKHVLRHYRQDLDQYYVRVQRKDDIRKLAKEIKSVDPDKQALLDDWENIAILDRTPSHPKSAKDIYNRWAMLIGPSGELPSAYNILKARVAGIDTYPSSVLEKYFGVDTDTGKTLFTTATRRLAALHGMEPAERDRVLDSIVVDNMEDKLLAEGRRLLDAYGEFTTTLLRRLIKTGETPYPVASYSHYLGMNEDTKKRYFSVAKKRVMGLTE